MSNSQHFIRNRCFGYVRVSTDDQELNLQVDALIRFGIDQSDIFTDPSSTVAPSLRGEIVEKPRVFGGSRSAEVRNVVP